VTVSSFSPAVVAEVRGTAPRQLGVRTALLGDVRDRPTSLLRQALQDGHDQVHPNVAALLAEPSAVGRAHALGVGVVPWTVNRGRALRRLAALGVDGFITDVPRSARLALAVDARTAA
jgi:glycerophosphoryl diester phosphodiesterase